MTRDDIWNALKTSILEIFPEYVTKNISQEENLHDLGANSIDRAEIIMLTLMRLKLKIPLIKFAQTKNIGGLVDIFYQQHM